MVRLRWLTFMGWQMSDELRLLLISILLLVLGFVALTWQTKECYQLEYQNLTGTHFKQVCEGDK
jgi:hypothetical protein